MRRDFARAAASYDAAAVLARATGERLAERLAYTRLTPRTLADVGCATGDGVRLLQQRYPAARALAVDFAAPMLAQVRARRTLLARLRARAPLPLQADVRQLPLADGTLDLLWSNLMLHWLDEPLPALREMHRVLAVGGLLTFALFGPDTARQWRAALAKETFGGTAPAPDTAAKESFGGTAPRTFPDMHDIGDMLVAAGFSDPVMDREDIILTYPSARALVAEQRHLGVRNALFGLPAWRSARAAFAAWERDPDGRLPIGFEIVYGQAWKAAAKPATHTPEGHAIVRFAAN